MRSSPGPAVRVDDLRVAFSSRHSSVEALRGLSLTAERGEITTILGTNGAGKSTLLNVLHGLVSPTSGSAEVLGTDVTASSPELRARVGVMLQETGLPPASRPLPFLRHLSRFYASPRPVDELARSLGIDEFAGTQIRRLSGGQRQRVALAAAVVGRPELCMLDEPSAGLDPISRETVVEFVEGLRAEGTSVVLTTHLLDDAERLSDTVHIMSRGEVRQSGTVEELVAGSSSRTLRLTAHPDAERAVAALLEAARRRGLEVQEERTPRSHSVVVTGDVPREVLDLASACGRTPEEPPVSLSLTHANLTDIFFQTAREDA
ncbi:ABC transporter ATP-binding protein [Arthrobacter sp. UM1]|uniref:ABC transporter ATP-binding protein n=1 Tax=Arthrobacter sp. UM1 TaxID=2766776 RepID=UPI001CF6249A|nr:ABC transporter ATP-binding protein [Arthrobacter sp. UM1]